MCKDKWYSIIFLRVVLKVVNFCFLYLGSLTTYLVLAHKKACSFGAALRLSNSSYERRLIPRKSKVPLQDLLPNACILRCVNAKLT